MQKTATLYKEVVDFGGRNVTVVIADLFIDGTRDDSRVFNDFAEARAALVEAGYETALAAVK